ncbi:MAG: amidohydrolase family protein, partial [Acidobacteria bacterium]|nr:amidohydrolase family protein [Acidobacteriota bacterium]
MSKFLRKPLLCFMLLPIAAIPHVRAQAGPPEAVLHYADLVLYNGKVLKADERFTLAEAIAVRDGKFLAVGSNQEILPLAGPRTQRIDLNGRCVIPGFVETHLHQAHVGNGATERGRKRLEMKTVERALEELRAELKGLEPGKWLVVGGPRSDVFYKLTIKELDAVSPQNPLAIINMNEEALVNSLALKEAAIPRDTPGYILDPQTAEPTGHLARWASGTLIYEKLPWPPLTEELLQEQKDMLKILHSKG